MPTMRECDDAAVRMARIFIDTDAALAEAGDIVQPLQSGAISADRIAGTLYSLCRGEAAGRQSRDQVTLFKSVGSALEDVAAAGLAMRNLA